VGLMQQETPANRRRLVITPPLEQSIHYVVRKAQSRLMARVARMNVRLDDNSSICRW